MKIKKMIALFLVVGGLFSTMSACVNRNEATQTNKEVTSDLGKEETTANTEGATQAPSDPTPDDSDKTDDQTKPSDSKVTIACIGDSITEGVGVDAEDRGEYSYPARLAKALGDGYEVLNYGKSGATMCSTSALLYPSKNWFTYSGKHEELKKRSKDIDIAFIMLGTNDGNSSNADISDLMTNRVDSFRADYEANLTQMVTELRNGNKDVKIYLMTSPKCFRTGNTWEQTLTDVVRPLQLELAEKLSLYVYDMYTFTANTVKAGGFPDNLHPGMRGYYLIGRELARVVAELYDTELCPDELQDNLNFEETFDSVANGTTFTQQEDTTVTIGNSTFKVRVKENSSLTVNDGVLALTRSATNTDAFIDVLMDESLVMGKYTFEISIKASEAFDSRGAIFFAFGYQFLKYTTSGAITNNGGTTIGQLTSDRFMKITLTVESETGAYQIFLDDVQVDTGTVTFKETATFRPIQFFANGSSTLYLDYIKAYKITEN